MNHINFTNSLHHINIIIREYVKSPPLHKLTASDNDEDLHFTNLLHQIIMRIWKPGLTSEYKKSGGHEFILAEKPWWCESTEAIRTRYFICDLLELLYARVST